jgi:general stress protein 26
LICDPIAIGFRFTNYDLAFGQNFYQLKEQLYQFISRNKLAVLAYLADGKPQSALVGIAGTPALQLVFDTIVSSRKYPALLKNPEVSMVIGWDDEVTVQYEGKAILLRDGDDDNRLREIYYKAYPDGRNRASNWPGLVHFKIEPVWVRYVDFREPDGVCEMWFE